MSSMLQTKGVIFTFLSFLYLGYMWVCLWDVSYNQGQSLTWTMVGVPLHMLSLVLDVLPDG
jgi:hypothetical protein